MSPANVQIVLCGSFLNAKNCNSCRRATLVPAGRGGRPVATNASEQEWLRHTRRFIPPTRQRVVWSKASPAPHHTGRRNCAKAVESPSAHPRRLPPLWNHRLSLKRAPEKSQAISSYCNMQHKWQFWYENHTFQGPFLHSAFPMEKTRNSTADYYAYCSDLSFAQLTGRSCRLLSAILAARAA